MHVLLTFISFCVFVILFNNAEVNADSVHNRSRREVNAYPTKYDNLDVDKIIQSKRLLLNYVNCLLDKGPCSPEGRDLKKFLPDALATNCAKCSENQKKHSGKVFSYLLLNYRDEWNQLVDKYDREGTYRKKYHIDEDYDYSQLDDA